MSSDAEEFWNDVVGDLRSVSGFGLPTPEEARGRLNAEEGEPLSDKEINSIVNAVVTGEGAPEAESTGVPGPLPVRGDSPSSGHETRPPNDMASLVPGQIISGRYEVVRQLGQGGMGTVWLVRDRKIGGVPRALKLIAVELAHHPGTRDRFRREILAMARVNHPCAVTVHDADATDGGIPYIVMEYIQGTSLKALLRPGVPMPLDWIARFLAQLCDVLQEFHDHSIVHRDLKPSNLMLIDGRSPGREQLKVVDFGIAKLLGAEESLTTTQTGIFLGTLPYASPEQVDGTVDIRSDVYSAGMILYELLTGYQPFTGARLRVVYDTQYTPPPSFSRVNPGAAVPKGIEGIVLRCLSKDPKDRPRSVLTLWTEFKRALPNEPGPLSPTRNGPRKLLSQVTCPHCWHRFAPEDVLWVAAHGDLHRDQLLGEQQQRFLPSRFTPDGHALDPSGRVCRELACPRCHLGILRGMLEMEPLFISIVGEQASGKSYFLTALIQQLRQILFHDFAVRFGDADPASNSTLTGYIESVFSRGEEDTSVPLRDLIKKTALQGDLYDSVTVGEQAIWYPRPFTYTLQPTPDHPRADEAAQLSRMLCLYDNAGEHFRPGGNKVANPCADHLALSGAILFLFDPSQDRTFRAFCRGETQALAGMSAPAQQTTILHEVAKRVRDYTDMPQDRRYGRPLVVVLTKFDAWSHLLHDPSCGDPWKRSPHTRIAGLDMDCINRRSRELRELMNRYCPDVVAAAEGFAEDVTYIAVSALADRYEPDLLQVDPQTRIVSIRPKDVRPYWAAVPLLYALGRALPGLIWKIAHRENGSDAGPASNGVAKVAGRGVHRDEP
jgi:serine/threonine protein kinase